MKTGRLSWRVREALEQGLQWGRPGSGRGTNEVLTKCCGRVGNGSEAIDRCTGTRYNPSMIRSFRHRGLRRLYERGDPSRIGADQLDRITLALADLDAATNPSELDLPGYRLHPLRAFQVSPCVIGQGCRTPGWAGTSGTYGLRCGRKSPRPPRCPRRTA